MKRYEFLRGRLKSVFNLVFFSSISVLIPSWISADYVMASLRSVCSFYESFS